MSDLLHIELADCRIKNVQSTEYFCCVRNVEFVEYFFSPLTAVSVIRICEDFSGRLDWCIKNVGLLNVFPARALYQEGRFAETILPVDCVSSWIVP